MANGARSIDHPLHIIRTDLSVFHCNHTVTVNPFDMPACDSCIDRGEVVPCHQLCFFDRLFDRMDGALDIDDHTLPQSLRWKGPETDDVDLTVRDFSNHGADFCRPDVQSDDQRIFLPHLFITSFQVPLQGAFLTTILFKSLQSIETAENSLLSKV